MKCLNCGNEKTDCKDSRANGGLRRRRYHCPKCNFTFSTRETYFEYLASNVTENPEDLENILQQVYNTKSMENQELFNLAKKQLHYELKHANDTTNQQTLAIAYLALCRIPKETYIL